MDLEPGALRSLPEADKATDGAAPESERTGTGYAGLLRWVRRVLFPDPPADRPARPWLGRTAGALIVTVAIGVTTLRLPMSRWDSLWAEDGAVFLQQSLHRPLWQLLFAPFAGYLNVAPRLMTAAVRILPIEYAGYGYTLCAAAMIVWVAWTTWHFSAGHIRSTWLRFALAATVVLVPAGGLEVTGSIANSHFFLVFGAFWALLGHPRSRPALVSAVAMVLLATMSDPVAFALAPLAVLRLLAVPRRQDRVITLANLAGLVTQLCFVVLGHTSAQSPPTLHQAVFGYVFRVVSPDFIGLEQTDRLLQSSGPSSLEYVAAAVLLVFVAGVLAAPHHRIPVLVTGAASVAIYAVACYVRGYPPRGPAEHMLALGSRYTVLPELLLLSAWLLIAEGVLGRVRRSRRSLVVFAAIAPIAISGVLDFRPDFFPVRDGVPAWSAGVEQAREACAVSPERPPFRAPIGPPVPVGYWNVPLTCHDVG